MVTHQLLYLTVQDLLWINLQVTGTVNKFDYARLEDGAFYQYGYGKSKDLLAQAARFYPGLKHKAAFTAGNEATAFVAFAAFLLLNGRVLKIKDTAGSLDDFPPVNGLAWVEKNTAPDPDHHHYTEGEAMRTVLAKYPKLIAALSK